MVYTANWGIRKITDPTFIFFWEPETTGLDFLFPDRPALIIGSLAHIYSTTFPWRGGRLGHHCQPSQESRKLRDMKILIRARVDQLPILGMELIPPLVEILIIGILTPLRNWVDEFIPYGNHGSLDSPRSHIIYLP